MPRQPLDAPENLAKQRPCQVAFRELQREVPGVPDQPPAGLEQPLLEARQRSDPFKKLARMLRTHLDGVLVWTKLRVSNGALEGMNNKVKVIWTCPDFVDTMATVTCRSLFHALPLEGRLRY